MALSETQIQQLWDKQAITENLTQYCRGIDRADRAAFESAFWPDAHDDHINYVGDVPGMVEFVFKAISKMRTHHMNGNVLIEFADATTAHVESYVHAYHEGEGIFGTQEMFFAARYLDVFEKRGEEWRIKRRKVIMDYYATVAATLNWESGRYRKGPSRGEKMPDDPLYSFFAPQATP